MFCTRLVAQAAFAVVLPEPSSLALMLSVGFGFTARRIFRRK